MGMTSVWKDSFSALTLMQLTVDLINGRVYLFGMAAPHLALVILEWGRHPVLCPGTLLLVVVDVSCCTLTDFWEQSDVTWIST
jgi:hypothetical protein